MSNEKQQLQEAIAAGRRALRTIGDVEKKLGSAEGWGMFDMLGGGFIATLAKRSSMKDARRLMDDLRRDLAMFQREVRDVEILTDLELDDDGLVAFADYVFDGILADVLVQSAINRAQKQLQNVRRQVESIVQALENKQRTL